jgi:hypothetical protein
MKHEPVVVSSPQSDMVENSGFSCSLFAINNAADFGSFSTLQVTKVVQKSGGLGPYEQAKRFWTMGAMPPLIVTLGLSSPFCGFYLELGAASKAFWKQRPQCTGLEWHHLTRLGTFQRT